jgi:hypothetical protein
MFVFKITSLAVRSVCSVVIAFDNSVLVNEIVFNNSFSTIIIFSLTRSSAALIALSTSVVKLSIVAEIALISLFVFTESSLISAFILSNCLASASIELRSSVLKLLIC